MSLCLQCGTKICLCPVQLAQNVPIVDQPEAYAKMREEAGYCQDFGSQGAGAHYGSCPRIAAAVAQMPQPTAYERDQQALRDRVTAQAVRLDDALRRIEQLENEVARLKAPRECAHDWEYPVGAVTTCTKCGAKRLVTAAGPLVVMSSPATAYPPIPDEGT